MRMNLYNTHQKIELVSVAVKVGSVLLETKLGLKLVELNKD